MFIVQQQKRTNKLCTGTAFELRADHRARRNHQATYARQATIPPSTRNNTNKRLQQPPRNAVRGAATHQLQTRYGDAGGVAEPLHLDRTVGPVHVYEGVRVRCLRA